MGKKALKTPQPIAFNPETHYMHPYFGKPYLKKKNVQMVLQTADERAASRKAARKRAYWKKKNFALKALLKQTNAKFGFVENKGTWALDECLGVTTNKADGVIAFIGGREFTLDAHVKFTSAGGNYTVTIRDFTHDERMNQ